MTGFKKKLFTHGGVFALVVIALGGGFYVASVQVRGVGTGILALKSEMRAARREILEFTELKGGRARGGAALEVLRGLVPKRDDLFAFSAGIQAIARDRNLRSGFSFGNETPGSNGTPGDVTFNMSIEGSLSNITAFIEEIETSGSLIELSQVTISGDGANASARLDGKVFFVE